MRMGIKRELNQTGEALAELAQRQRLRGKMEIRPSERRSSRLVENPDDWPYQGEIFELRWD
jgi:hypothetical protein